MPVPKVWATPPKYAPRDAFPAVAEACGRIQELDEGKTGFESPNLTWLPPRTRAALRFGTGRGGCNDVQRERLRACRGLWDGRARMPCRPEASRASRFCPSSPHGSLLAPRGGASAARLCSSEQRGSTSPLKVRPPPVLRNIGRNRSSSLLPPKYASCHASHSVADACGRPQLDECREPECRDLEFQPSQSARASRVLRQLVAQVAPGVWEGCCGRLGQL